MGTEIEKKFLVREHLLPNTRDLEKKRLEQAYLGLDPVTRVRRIDGFRCLIGLKGKGNIERPEFEYLIPTNDFDDLRKEFQVGNLIEKVRTEIGPWELDEFEGKLEGKKLVEIELSHKDEEFEKPIWVGDEVTHDSRYTNVSLALFGWPNDEEEVVADLWTLSADGKTKTCDLSKVELSPEMKQLAHMYADGFTAGRELTYEPITRTQLALFGMSAIIGGLVFEIIRLVL